jgi:hypothetical protein
MNLKSRDRSSKDLQSTSCSLGEYRGVEHNAASSGATIRSLLLEDSVDEITLVHSVSATQALEDRALGLFPNSPLLSSRDPARADMAATAETADRTIEGFRTGWALGFFLPLGCGMCAL